MLKFFFGDRMANFIVSVKILTQLIHTVQAYGVVFKCAAYTAPLVIEIYRFVTYLSEYKINLEINNVYNQRLKNRKEHEKCIRIVLCSIQL
jgi:hypothetical protein